MFLFLALLLLTVRSHVNFACTHSSVDHPSQLNFYFFTYHDTPSAGGSVPGTTTIQTPSGNQFTFAFTSFANLQGVLDSSTTVDELREVVRTAPITSDASGETMESRYGDFAGFVCYEGNANVGSVLSGTALPDQRFKHSLSPRGSVKTVYMATINEVSSGTYLFWTDGTNFNLDSGCTGFVGACIDGQSQASQITVNVVSTGSSCSSSSFPASTDFSAPSSLASMSLPGTVVQPDCVPELPHRSGIVTCLADGTWDSTVACSAQPGCANAAYDPNALSVIGVEAITSEHRSCDDFTIASGSVCHVVCENGQYAPGSYQVACVGNDEWQVVDSGTCLPNSASNPPSPPKITNVDYDYERMIVTVTFNFTNGANDDLVHTWRVEASNADLGPQNQLNTVINTGFLELSMPANESSYHLEEICYNVTVENSVGIAISQQYCAISTVTPTLAPSTTAISTVAPTLAPSTTEVLVEKDTEVEGEIFIIIIVCAVTLLICCCCFCICCLVCRKRDNEEENEEKKVDITIVAASPKRCPASMTPRASHTPRE
jgi:hypothetical protein